MKIAHCRTLVGVDFPKALASPKRLPLFVDRCKGQRDFLKCSCVICCSVVEHKRGGDITKNLLVIVHNVDCHRPGGEEDDGLDQSLNLQKQLLPLRAAEIICMLQVYMSWMGILT